MRKVMSWMAIGVLLMGLVGCAGYQKTMKMRKEIREEEFILIILDSTIQEYARGKYRLTTSVSYENIDVSGHIFGEQFALQMVYQDKYRYDYEIPLRDDSVTVRPLEKRTISCIIDLPEEVGTQMREQETPFLIVITHQASQKEYQCSYFA